MSNSSNNPFNPLPEEKGPWLYSGGAQPTPGYVPPLFPAVPPQPPATPAAPPAASTPESQPAPTPATPEADQPNPSTPSTPAAPPAPAGKPPQRVVKKSEDASLASIVDTIEAIIIALVLALTFRAFIVEAFVIPTGSMAPTLLGAHFNVICPKCGYAFKWNAELQFQRVGNTLQDLTHRAELTDNRAIPSEPFGSRQIICPNCQYPIDPDQLPQRLTPRTLDDRTNRGLPSPRTIPFAWANNGDRILVWKYLYSLMKPHRFDVIVFKEPMMAQDNYIKRLIGLPGETVEVIQGDVYIGPPGKTDAADRVIARKPAFLQKDLWELVYDNDYYPIDEGEARPDGTVWHNPWGGAGTTAASWNIHSPKFTYDSPSHGMVQFNLRDPYTFNVLGYNNDIPYLQSSQRGITLQRVGDLRLETVWTPAEVDGTSIGLTLGKPENQFRVTWSGGIELDRYNPRTHLFEKVETLPHDPPLPGKSYSVALDNVDRSIRFFIDGREALEYNTPWNAAQAEKEAAADDADPLAWEPAIRIEVGGKCTLGHTKVFRDLYYTQNDPNSSITVRTANRGNPLTLGPDEYFAMGDNSRMSADGRLWDSVYPALDDLGTRVGIVPQRYLLGKAFFVYWPAGFRVTTNSDVPVLSNLPLVPNAGEMRLIR